MSLEIYTQKDCQTHFLQHKSIGILGFGAQGEAQALNLRESGFKVKIGLQNGSKSIAKAEHLGFEVLSVQDLAKVCDVLMFLLPDERHKEVFLQIFPYLKRNHTLCFAHGFSVHFQEIMPPSFTDVILVAPKAAAKAVRGEFLQGRGVISLIGVHQDFSSNAKAIALELACGLGSGKSAIMLSSFKDECECDLFSEQSVICGGVDSLIRAGFETLVEAGYPEEIAYFECLHEVKLVVDLIYANGLESMRKHISNTAEYGDVIAGKQIITEQTKNTMKEILKQIQNQSFAKRFLQECQEGFPTLQKERQALHESQIEVVGRKMRGMMPWLKQS